MQHGGVSTHAQSVFIVGSNWRESNSRLSSTEDRTTQFIQNVRDRRQPICGARQREPLQRKWLMLCLHWANGLWQRKIANAENLSGVCWGGPYRRHFAYHWLVIAWVSKEQPIRHLSSKSKRGHSLCLLQEVKLLSVWNSHVTNISAAYILLFNLTWIDITLKSPSVCIFHTENTLVRFSAECKRTSAQVACLLYELVTGRSPEVLIFWRVFVCPKTFLQSFVFFFVLVGFHFENLLHIWKKTAF